MGMPVFPPELPDEAAYRSEIRNIEMEIAALEKRLGRLRRERGCRVMQLQQLICPTPPAPPSWSQRVQARLKKLLG